MAEKSNLYTAALANAKRIAARTNGCTVNQMYERKPNDPKPSDMIGKGTAFLVVQSGFQTLYLFRQKPGETLTFPEGEVMLVVNQDTPETWVRVIWPFDTSATRPGEIKGLLNKAPFTALLGKRGVDECLEKDRRAEEESKDE